MNDFPCCVICKGSSPYFFCKDKPKDLIERGCDCHQAQEKRASKQYNALSYNDPTPRTAFRRMGVRK